MDGGIGSEAGRNFRSDGRIDLEKKQSRLGIELQRQCRPISAIGSDVKMNGGVRTGEPGNDVALAVDAAVVRGVLRCAMNILTKFRHAGDNGVSAIALQEKPCL